MTFDWNVTKWQRNQWEAAGRQAGTFASGLVTAAVAMHFIPQVVGGEVISSIQDITEGATQLAKGIAGLTAAYFTIRNTLKSATKASPSEQVKSVVTNLSSSQITQAANAVADPTSRDKLIVAVSQMPEVRAVVADIKPAYDEKAPKVVATPAEAQGLPKV